MEENYVNSFDGSQIFYKTKKQKGPWLVLIHGGSGSSNSWSFQIPYFLDHGYSLIIPDMRGHGLSARGKGLDFFKIDNFVNDLKTILDNEGVNQAVLIGHSLGSQIIQRFDQLYPDRVKGQVLISTKFAEGRSRLLLLLVNTLMRFIFSISPAGRPNRNYTNYKNFRNTADLNPVRILSDISCCSFKTYAATILMGNLFENKHYREIQFPSLLIHGKKDMILPYKPVEKVAGEMKNFEFAALPTNHITLLNLPNEINETIGKFLAHLR
jgi:pimeloyl-ACP methyl ester carboxylesterase